MLLGHVYVTGFYMINGRIQFLHISCYYRVKRQDDLCMWEEGIEHSVNCFHIFFMLCLERERVMRTAYLYIS